MIKRAREHDGVSRPMERVVGRVFGEGTAKLDYLSQPTRIDRVFEITLLKLVPRRVSPNQITVFRFVVTPLIIILLLSKAYVLGTILFFLAAFSDAVDGALARTTDRVTPWGIVFDPVADKLLIGSVALVLVVTEIGAGLAWAMIGIEAALIASVYIRYGGAVVPARAMGKIKMILQCTGLGMLLFYVNLGIPVLLIIASWILYASLVFALLSLFAYRSV
ncbi:MAG: CDP-alcohol phosphatidyltransferase family protein [Patescibacteria group bacterium]|nr:CDP-alcohol phosphatidyltransferase family protein [Patescibacteria group bacterium]